MSISPNVIKALIASESGFRKNPSGNTQAFGIAQITKQTLKTLQDYNGESKNFLFKNIRQKDLLDPTVAIPMAIRWLHHKKAMAKRKLKRSPTREEIILEYKGLLTSQSTYKVNALKKFRKSYEELSS